VAQSIRVYNPEDEQAVVELWNQVFPDDPPWNEPKRLIASKLTVQPELFFVCVIEQRVVGTVMAGFDGVRGWVHKVAVHPGFKRQGVARALMNAAEAGLAAMGCTKINLQVRGSNESAAEFYRAIGYEDEDRISLGKRLETGERSRHPRR
jgi:ribosomal protein S18 acetylase RimI-like enzyme